jgi:broad specificity phosphatase PhoE
MTLLAVIRHGPTEWNKDARLQGRSDVPLSSAGRHLVASWRVPSQLVDFEWLTSPLKRAVETAMLLTRGDVAKDHRLIEMDWAKWEGRRLLDLRAEFGIEMTALEARGLDFRPPGGESPRDVQQRLQAFLEERRRIARPTVAVCHKGIIRALYALAANWDMTGKPPHKLQANCAHLLRITGDGLEIVHLNLSLHGDIE